MKQVKLGLAVAGMAVSIAVGAALWPHARDAGAILAAQDDPAELADLRLNSALRNGPALLAENIEAALAAGDADLAGSFIELARDRNIAVVGDRSHRQSRLWIPRGRTAKNGRQFWRLYFRRRKRRGAF